MGELERTGVRLALDWGTARIGVAACDPRGTLSYPVETIQARQGPEAVGRRVLALVAEYDPIEIVVGLPRHLAGAEGASATLVRERAAWLAGLVTPVPIRLVDERLTTVTASRALHEAGRDTRRQRAVIDQAAAVAVLDHALDAERATGKPAGEVVPREGLQA